jgi:hypothetical protein
MTNFRLGKIYRIECLTTGKQYIGSTCEPTLARRLTYYVSAYKRYLAGTNKHKTTIFDIIEGGNYQITLLESYPCDGKDELTARGGHYIRTLDCVNKKVPGKTEKEFREEVQKDIQEEMQKRTMEKETEPKFQGPEYLTKCGGCGTLRHKTGEFRFFKGQRRKTCIVCDGRKERARAVRLAGTAQPTETKDTDAPQTTRVQCYCGCWLAKTSLLSHQRSQTHINTMTTMEAATLQAPPAEAAAAELLNS